MRVSSDAGTGSYALRLDLARGLDLESEYNDAAGSADQLSFASAGTTRRAAVAATLETTSDRDYFGWGTINAGNAIELTATVLSPSTLSA